MKKAISLVLVMIMMLTVFSGCASDSEKIVGTWKYTKTVFSVVTEHKYVFNADGTGTAPGETGLIDIPMTYKIDKDQLTVTTDIYGEKTFTFSFEKDTLTLTDSDGTSVVMTRVEG